MDPKELHEFEHLPIDEKFRFLFVTLYNHISAVREIKWLTRILIASLMAGLVKMFLLQ